MNIINIYSENNGVCGDIRYAHVFLPYSEWYAEWPVRGNCSEGEWMNVSSKHSCILYTYVLIML